MILAVDSVTFAMKAKRLLMREGIRAEAVKITANSDTCAHGIRISDGDILDAARVLREGRINYTVLNGK